MTAQALLSDDWSDYELAKEIIALQEGHSDEDPQNPCATTHAFCCSDPWERNYLIEKIVRKHAEYSLIQIQAAMAVSYKLLGSPCPRKLFLESFVARLNRM